MPVTRSDEYYIPEGDIVLQVEDTVFRLHRYILGTYSGLFREMFSAPGNNSKEGSTDAKLLRLPTELCSVQSFTTLCQFMYPKKFGVFPEIQVQDLDVWETVIQATQALQMADIQDYILSRLEEDKPDVAKEAVRLLCLATRASHKSLEFECLRTLANRHRPISQAEGATMGGQATAQVAFIRERIRIVLLSTSQELRSSVLLHNSCRDRTSCQKKIVERILEQATNKPIADSQGDDYNYDIFQIRYDHPCSRDDSDGEDGPLNYSGLCRLCGPTMDELAASLKKAKLDNEIRECIKALV